MFRAAGEQAASANAVVFCPEDALVSDSDLVQEVLMIVVPGCLACQVLKNL